MTNQTAVQLPVTNLAHVFRFRAKDKDTAPRTAVELNIPVPSADALSIMFGSELGNEALNNARELVLDVVGKIVVDHVKAAVDADEAFTQDTLDALEGIDLVAISNIPRSTRTMLTNVDIAAFADDYEVTMVAAGVQNEQQAATAAAYFKDRLRAVAGHQQAIAALTERLGQYLEVANEDQLNTHERVITYLDRLLNEAANVQISVEF